MQSFTTFNLPYYETHDNGGIKYFVYDDKINKKIYIYDNYSESNVMSVNYLKIFIPTEDSIGNSVLLNTKNKKYMYIGSNISCFEALNEIVEYSSPIGNSDVPYPFALDKNGKAYLMIENVIVENFKIENPYQFYYKKKYLSHYSGSIGDFEVFLDFKNYKNLIIGNNKYNISYCPNPTQDYNRLLAWNEGAIMIETKDGIIKPLSIEEYIEINNFIKNKFYFKNMLINELHK